MDMVKFVIFGAIVGVANIIPGVSGGTMAVILKIYDRLIETLSLKNVKKNLPFIIPLGIGAAVGIVLFSKAIEFLLGNYPMATNFTFMGLILGSIPMIFQRARGEKMEAKGMVSFLVALVVMVVIALLKPAESNAVLALTPLNLLILFGASAISTFAMILPGISGSFVMLVLGVYTTVLTSISGVFILAYRRRDLALCRDADSGGARLHRRSDFWLQAGGCPDPQAAAGHLFRHSRPGGGVAAGCFPQGFSGSDTGTAHRAGSAGGSGFRRLQVFENLTRLDIFRRCGILPEDTRSVWLPARYRTADFQAGGRLS